MSNIFKNSTLSGVYIYDEARTVHLDRLKHTENRGLIFRKTSYDFHSDLRDRDRVFHLSTISTMIFIIKNQLTTIEINEPLFLRAIPRIILFIITIRIMDKIRHHRTLVVSYCIENSSTSNKINDPTIRSFLLKILFFASFLIIREYDRLVFGTEGALIEYKKSYGKKISKKNILIPPIEPKCDACPLRKRSNHILFIGAFDDRKGVMELIESWNLITKLNKNLKLNLLGKGPLSSRIIESIKHDNSIAMEIDPSREAIHAALSNSSILVLLSKTSKNWREQVGLPILEGLSHGCKIVATNATGISDWLINRGHHIISEPATSDKISEAILAALKSQINPDAILDTLPKESGRSQADEWLWRSGTA